jgi:hypothetical protein
MTERIPGKPDGSSRLRSDVAMLAYVAGTLVAWDR